LDFAGLILTEGIEAWLARYPNPEAERRCLTAQPPCGRIDESTDAANAALFLVSDEARLVNDPPRFHKAVRYLIFIRAPASCRVLELV
jgi:hypothetical protein